jgi:hypothetical protein
MNTFLKTNWKRMLVLIGLVFVIVLVVICWPRRQQTLFVLPEPVPVDSVHSVPSRAEQSAEDRWNSLKTIQP